MAESPRTRKHAVHARLVALNRFIDDLYNARAIIDDGVFPAELSTATVRVCGAGGPKTTPRMGATSP